MTKNQTVESLKECFDNSLRGKEQWNLFLQLESVTKKLTQARLDVNFLNKCLDYNVIPNFINFKLWNKSLHYSKPTLRYKTKLLRSEIDRQRVKLKKLEQQKTNISNRLFSETNLILSTRIRSSLATTEQKINDETTACHDKKFSKLCNIQPFDSSSTFGRIYKEMMAFRQ